MISLYCYHVDCAVDGIQVVWDDIAPTTCPLNAGHELNSVSRTPTENQAHNRVNINDGAGRVFQITVDQNGALSAAQVFGPNPI